MCATAPGSFWFSQPACLQAAMEAQEACTDSEPGGRDKGQVDAFPACGLVSLRGGAEELSQGTLLAWERQAESGT